MGKIKLDNAFETSLFKNKSFGNLTLTKLIVPFIIEQKLLLLQFTMMNTNTGFKIN